MKRLLWAIVSIGLSAAPAGAEPYKLDGLQLGMTLAELRRSPSLGAGNRVICNIDQEAEQLRPEPEYLPPRTANSGNAPFCGLYRYGTRVDRASSLPQLWYPTTTRLGSVEMLPAFQFVATEAPDSTARLAGITLRTNVTNWEALVSMLSSRFGKQATRSRPEPGPESRFADNEIITWDNGDSTIRAVKRSDLFHRTTVTFEHSGLAALARVRAAGG